MGLYHRQKPKHKRPSTLLQRLLTIAFIVLLALGLLSAAFLFFFRGYIVDTPNGPVLVAPFFSKSSSPSAEEAFSKSDTVSVPEQENTAPKLVDPLHAILLPQEAILNGTALEDVASAQGNCALFTMRGEDGRLFYVSQIPTAVKAGASSALPGLNDAIRKMNKDPDLYTIAKVSCFPDSKLSQIDPALALTRPSGSLWLDSAGTAWLSPKEDEVQAYLLDICLELASLGFDEILPTHSAYPSTDAANTQPWVEEDSLFSRTAVLEDFYAEMRHALEGENVRLSILWESPYEDDEAVKESGQSLSSLFSSAHRIWSYASEETLLSVFSSHGLSSKSLPIVSIIPEKGSSSSSWAIF